MILSNDDITKLPIVEKQPLIMSLNYLSYKKEEMERQREEMNKMKNKWNRT